jgi:hypothetical protein
VAPGVKSRSPSAASIAAVNVMTREGGRMSTMISPVDRIAELFAAEGAGYRPLLEELLRTATGRGVTSAG